MKLSNIFVKILSYHDDWLECSIIDHYCNVLQSSDIIINMAPNPELQKFVNYYPVMFKLNDNQQLVLMNNIQRFRDDTSPVISGKTGREECQLLNILGQYFE